MKLLWVCYGWCMNNLLHTDELLSVLFTFVFHRKNMDSPCGENIELSVTIFWKNNKYTWKDQINATRHLLFKIQIRRLRKNAFYFATIIAWVEVVHHLLEMCWTTLISCILSGSKCEISVGPCGVASLAILKRISCWVPVIMWFSHSLMQWWED